MLVNIFTQSTTPPSQIDDIKNPDFAMLFPLGWRNAPDDIVIPAGATITYSQDPNDENGAIYTIIEHPINPAWITWANGTGAIWRWDSLNGNPDVALNNIGLFLTGNDFSSLTPGQISGANQDAWTIMAAKTIGSEPQEFLP